MRPPKNDLEREFAYKYWLHGHRIKEFYEKAKKLSDETGIPFGTYIPPSFESKYKQVEDYVGSLADVDWTK